MELLIYKYFHSLTSKRVLLVLAKINLYFYF